MDFAIFLEYKRLHNLFVLELDCSLKIPTFLEKVPSENHFVSLKLMGKEVVRTEVFHKFRYLTKFIYESNSLLRSRCVLTRLRFVMMGLNLKRSIRKLFRNEIIDEIFMKMNLI